MQAKVKKAHLCVSLFELFTKQPHGLFYFTKHLCPINLIQRCVTRPREAFLLELVLNVINDNHSRVRRAHDTSQHDEMMSITSEATRSQNNMYVSLKQNISDLLIQSGIYKMTTCTSKGKSKVDNKYVQL